MRVKEKDGLVLDAEIGTEEYTRNLKIKVARLNQEHESLRLDEDCITMSLAHLKTFYDYLNERVKSSEEEEHTGLELKSILAVQAILLEDIVQLHDELVNLQYEISLKANEIYSLKSEYHILMGYELVSGKEKEGEASMNHDDDTSNNNEKVAREDQDKSTKTLEGFNVPLPTHNVSTHDYESVQEEDSKSEVSSEDNNVSTPTDGDEVNEDKSKQEQESEQEDNSELLEELELEGECLMEEDTPSPYLVGSELVKRTEREFRGFQAQGFDFQQ